MLRFLRHLLLLFTVLSTVIAPLRAVSAAQPDTGTDGMMHCQQAGAGQVPGDAMPDCCKDHVGIGCPGTCASCAGSLPALISTLDIHPERFVPTVFVLPPGDFSSQVAVPPLRPPLASLV